MLNFSFTGRYLCFHRSANDRDCSLLLLGWGLDGDLTVTISGFNCGFSAEKVRSDADWRDVLDDSWLEELLYWELSGHFASEIRWSICVVIHGACTGILGNEILSWTSLSCAYELAVFQFDSVYAIWPSSSGPDSCQVFVINRACSC